jgi:hypothetical protein
MAASQRTDDGGGRRCAPLAVTITREERDALWPDLYLLAPGDEPSFALKSSEKATSYRRELDVAIAMYEQLGWQEEDDREAFPLAIDPLVLREGLERLRSGALEAIDDDRAAIAKAGDDATIVEPLKQLIAGDERRVRICEAILERLDALDPDRRMVPIRFEDYLAVRGASEGDPASCTSCGRDGAHLRLEDAAGVYCEDCARYHHGFDQAEEKMVRNIVAAAIDAARGAGASDELVRAAIADAWSERVHVDAFACP